MIGLVVLMMEVIVFAAAGMSRQGVSCGGLSIWRKMGETVDVAGYVVL
jgi:hypothetical protein